jgi:hypothetical protein
MKTPIVPIFAALALGSSAAAQSTSFTYQGRLRNGTQLASGPHDFRFALFDAPAGGVQIGATQCADNVPVTEGLFTTVIDFGQQYATATQRLLEVQVRADTGLDCSNPAGFTVLERQPLLPAPLATHANAAFALDAPGGSHPGAVFVDSAGKVGIGTAAPQATLHVLTAGEGVRIQGPAVGNANGAWMSFFDSAGTEIGSVGDGSLGDRDVYLIADAGDVQLFGAAGAALTAKQSTGNVGIGVGAPGARLDVRGDIRLGSSGQFLAVAGDENLRIIRGVIDPDGVVLAGSGFTLVHPSAGHDNLTFTTPFSGTPTVIATAQGLGDDFFVECFAMTQSVTSSGANLQIFDRGGGTFNRRPIHFIVVGPR